MKGTMRAEGVRSRGGAPLKPPFPQQAESSLMTLVRQCQNLDKARQAGAEGAGTPNPAINGSAPRDLFDE